MLTETKATGGASPWKVVDASMTGVRGDKSRVAALERGVSLQLDEVAIDWDRAAEEGRLVLPLVLPSSEEVWFEFFPTQVLHPDLAAAFPDIRTFSGASLDRDPPLEADVDYTSSKGLRATIREQAQLYYVDALEDALLGRHYKSYASRDLVGEDSWSCNLHSGINGGGGGGGGGGGTEFDMGTFATPTEEARDETEEERAARAAAREQIDEARMRNNAEGGGSGRQDMRRALGTAAPVTQFHLTIAFIANGGYSKFHGNTKEAVMAELTTLVNRVNGIYKRELGVFFQLHPKTADLICLDPCPDLPNNSNIINKMDAYVQGRGVKLSSMDLGHGLTSSMGGLACLGSLCNEWRTCGMTGLEQPEADAFYVDYVSHEIGHQLNADHTFQDCAGHRGGANTAVEPGSGSTIMGYAGICGKSHNLQRNSDPYFHSTSLNEMHSYLVSTVGEEKSCGRLVESAEAQRPVADLGAPPGGACSVPVGNYLRLDFQGATGASGQSKEGFFYSIEPADSRQENDFLDRNHPRARSWAPTQRSYRHFPNLYTLRNSLQEDVLDEILPRAGSTSMIFRGTVRELYQRGGSSLDQESAAGFASFNSATIQVDFDAARAPLRLAEGVAGMSVSSRAPVELLWEVGDSAALSPTLSVLVAEDIMRDAGADFRYEDDVHALEWQEIAAVPNNGSAFVRFPTSYSNESYPALLMLRSEMQGGCSFFDFAAGITVHDSPRAGVDDDGPELVRSTMSPTTSAPTRMPTRAPTIRRTTATPSASPTLPPSLDVAERSTAPTAAPYGGTKVIIVIGSCHSGARPELVLLLAMLAGLFADA